jgi:hypothetical protein
MPLRVTVPVPIAPAPPAPAPFAPAAAPAAAILDVPYARQEQTEWCWAACSEMVARFLGNATVQQCELANFLHGQTDCCQTPGSAACNRPCPVLGVGLVYQHLHINCVSQAGPVNLLVIAQEINARRPVEVGYLWTGGGGHVALIRGYTAQGLLAVHDPWFGSGTVTYPAVLLAYGRGQWAFSFGDFRSL